MTIPNLGRTSSRSARTSGNGCLVRSSTARCARRHMVTSSGTNGCVPESTDPACCSIRLSSCRIISTGSSSSTWIARVPGTVGARRNVGARRAVPLRRPSPRGMSTTRAVPPRSDNPSRGPSRPSWAHSIGGHETNQCRTRHARRPRLATELLRIHPPRFAGAASGRNLHPEQPGAGIAARATNCSPRPRSIRTRKRVSSPASC